MPARSASSRTTSATSPRVADVVVVGSGPCGAVAAYELAAAGKRVVLLEEGPPFTPADFELEGSLSMARTMREGGLRFTMGTVMPTMQAIALGGGSLVNSAICNRCPDFRFEEWANEADLARTSRKDLEPHYDAIAAFLGIAPTPDDVQGPRNLLFRDGCKQLGYSVGTVPAQRQSSVAAAANASRVAARAPSSRWTSRTCPPRSSSARACSPRCAPRSCSRTGAA